MPLSTKHTPGPLLDLGPNVPPVTRQHWNELADDLHQAQNQCVNALAERDRYKAERDELLAALTTITEHAEETYPHFEDTRGQADIARARTLIAKIEGAK